MTARRHPRGFQWGLGRRRCSLHAHVHADCWTAVFPGCFTRTRCTPTLHTVKQFTCFGRATRARGFQQTGRDERLCQPQVASTCGCCLATLTDSYDCPRAASNTRHRRGTAQAHCRVFCCVQCRSSPVHRRLSALTTRRRLYVASPHLRHNVGPGWKRRLDLSQHTHALPRSAIDRQRAGGGG